MERLNRSLSRSLPRKRNLESINEFNKKRVCLEDFFTETVSAETVLSKFEIQLKKLLDEDICSLNLKKITRTIKQLKNRKLQNDILSDNGPKTIKKLSNFIKDGFVRDFHSSHEWDLEEWKSKVELTFEASLVCLFLLTNDDPKPECENYVNDIVFFLRKVIDDVNTQLSRAKEIKKVANPILKELLLRNLEFVNELIKNRTFNTLNITGLLTSFMNTVFYNPDLDIQMAALTAIISFYKKGDEFQALILNLTFDTIARVQEHHKFRKKYKIKDTLSISMFTILIMALIENVPIYGFFKRGESAVRTIQDSHNLLKESFDMVMKVSWFIVTTFIKKIDQSSATHKTYNLILGHLISELIDVCNEPEWPSARLVLNLFLKPFTEILVLKPPADANLKMLAVKVLGDIIKKGIYDRKTFASVIQSLNGADDFTEKAKRLLIRELFRTNKTALNENCISVHGIQWFENIKQEVNFEEKMADLIKLFTESFTGDPKHLQENEKRAIVYYLDTTRRNYADYHVILKYLLCCCFDKNKKIKLAATQYVFELVHLDIELLSQSLVPKILYENLLLMPQPTIERTCVVIKKYLSIHPEKSDEYGSFLLRLLDVQIGNNYTDMVLNVVKNLTNPQRKTMLCCKVLNRLQNTDPNVQKQSVDFFSDLWLEDKGRQEENLQVLLEIADMPNAAKSLKLFFEEKLKPPCAPLMSDTPSQPASQTVDLCRSLVSLIVRKIENDDSTLKCLQALSVLVMVCPNALADQFLPVAFLLTRHNFSNGYAVEILTAEVLNHVLPEVINPDMHAYVSLRTQLLERITSEESLNYPMGLIVSLLKLIINLSKFDKDFLSENLLEPSLQTLKEYHTSQDISDNRIINKALCIVIYLHIYSGESENFNNLLQYYIDHGQFGLTTIHSLCYLSMDHKQIMKNEVVMKTIHKHLHDKSHSVLLKGVLYNILCSLKRINKGHVIGDDAEPVKNITQTFIKEILDCTIDVRCNIRQTSYAVVRQMLTSGLIPEPRLIPSVLLMSTDPVDSLADIGMETLPLIQPKKLFDFIRNATKCILASLVFNMKCSKQSIIRGYEVRRGQTRARCNHFYALYQEEVMMRREIIDSILEGLSLRARTNSVEKLYLSDHLVYFNYKYQEEVFYVLWQIELMCPVPLPETIPAEGKDRISFIDKHYGLFMLTYVKMSLMYYYGFNDEKLKKYYQEDGKKDLVQTKKYLVHDVPQNSLPGAKNLAETIFETLKKKEDERLRSYSQNLDK
ncbi:UNVERIFIED_CONTAM: hypothetical protein PYX00_000580 [Menopon gallinae]|uniref:Nipped-B protein n=1 Tax=Menopon gallinae TaxID=328185 RepID=A0AAW2I9R6_9NEOP